MQGLKRIDRYILGKYLKTFLLALALIIIIVITFDVSEKLDKFLEHHATLWQIISIYYLNFIPGFVNLYSPLFIFISVIFFTSKMAGDLEMRLMSKMRTMSSREKISSSPSGDQPKRAT